jgi:hypothetical protein
MNISLKSGELKHTITVKTFEKIKYDWIHASIQYLKSTDHQKIIRNDLINKLEHLIENEKINYKFFENVDILSNLTEFHISGIYYWILMNKGFFNPGIVANLLETNKILEPFLSYTYKHSFIYTIFENSIRNDIPLEVKKIEY